MGAFRKIPQRTAIPTADNTVYLFKARASLNKSVTISRRRLGASTTDHHACARCLFPAKTSTLHPSDKHATDTLDHVDAIVARRRRGGVCKTPGVRWHHNALLHRPAMQIPPLNTSLNTSLSTWNSSASTKTFGFPKPCSTSPASTSPTPLILQIPLLNTSLSTWNSQHPQQLRASQCPAPPVRHARRPRP